MRVRPQRGTSKEARTSVTLVVPFSALLLEIRKPESVGKASPQFQKCPSHTPLLLRRSCHAIAKLEVDISWERTRLACSFQRP